MHCKIILFFFQILILCNEYNSINANPLIGHNIREANVGEFNYVVCFLKKAEFLLPSNVFCSGTLISRSIVLTAHNCFDGITTEGFEIRVGSIDLRYADRYLSMWWLGFQTWKEIRQERLQYVSNDIAVTKLIVPVSNAIIPAVPSQIPNRHLFGTHVLIVGWDKANIRRMSITMQIANITILHYRDCLERVMRLSGIYTFVTHAQLCSFREPYTLLDPSDRGGPILRSNMVVGVNTGKFPDLEHFNTEVVNIHASVNYYRRFITEVLEESN